MRKQNILPYKLAKKDRKESSSNNFQTKTRGFISTVESRLLEHQLIKRSTMNRLSID